MSTNTLDQLAAAHGLTRAKSQILSDALKLDIIKDSSNKETQLRNAIRDSRNLETLINEVNKVLQNNNAMQIQITTYYNNARNAYIANNATIAASTTSPIIESTVPSLTTADNSRNLPKETTHTATQVKIPGITFNDQSGDFTYGGQIFKTEVSARSVRSSDISNLNKIADIKKFVNGHVNNQHLTADEKKFFLMGEVPLVSPGGHGANFTVRVNESLEHYENDAKKRTDALRSFLDDRQQPANDLPPAVVSPGGSLPSQTGPNSPTPENTTPAEPAKPKYRLIRGDGENKGENVLEGNGHAIYVVNERGERFHVTRELYEDLQASGDMGGVEMLNQGDVDKMPLRFSVTSRSSLDGINNPPVNDFMLIKGNGTGLGDGVIANNGDAIFAVDKNGNMFHVSREVYNQMGEPPFVTIGQTAVNNMGVDGVLTSPTTTAPLPGGSTPGDGTNPSLPVMPAPANPGNPSQPPDRGSPILLTIPRNAWGQKVNGRFRLFRGNGSMDLPDNQLEGNGNAVYIVNERGERFHVTRQMVADMKRKGLWYDPEVVDQEALDGMAFRYSLSNVAHFDTVNNRPINGFMVIKGDGKSLGPGITTGNGDALFAVDNKGNLFHIGPDVYKEMGNPSWVEIDQAAVDSMGVDGTMISANTGRLYDFTHAGPGSGLAPLAPNTPLPAPEINDSDTNEGAGIVADAVAPAIRQIEQITPAPIPQPATPTVSPGPHRTDDIHEKLINELNPTGSISKHHDLMNFFIGVKDDHSDDNLKSDYNPTGSIKVEKEVRARAGGASSQSSGSIYSTVHPVSFTGEGHRP